MEQLVANPNLSADDAKEMEQAQRELSERGELNAKQACAVFSVIAEIGGAPDGATHVVQYLPVGDDSIAVSGQQCTDGRFTSIAFQKPGLRETPDLARQVMSALSAAHRRAVAAVR